MAMVAEVGTLYKTRARRLESIVCRDVSAPAALIEDACQVAWYRLLVHAERVDDSGAASWLAPTAIREAKRLKRRRERDLSLEDQIDRRRGLDIPSGAPSSHQRAEWREQLELLQRLPESQQRVLLMQAAGLSYDEIAASHPGLIPRTVERQMWLGRRKLRTGA